MFGLVADAPLMRPGVGTIAKAGKGALTARSTMTPDDAPDHCASSLQPGVAAYSDSVLQAEELAEFVKKRA